MNLQPLLSPASAYASALTAGHFQPDVAQQQAVHWLDRCHMALHQSGPTSVLPRGVYLWGPVGRGKTWLMDLFQRSLQVPSRRLHFHHFIRWVHQRQFQLTGTANPLQALAQELAAEVRVLCFDELFINDIGDAILVGQLLQTLLELGVVLVATSNQPPSGLYADGFNRERLLPAIGALEAAMEVVCVDGGRDHRLQPGKVCQRYWVQDPANAQSALAPVFSELIGDIPPLDGTLVLGAQKVPVIQRTARVLWTDFAALCEAPLAAMDFIELCDQYQHILLSAVPVLAGGAARKGIARGTEDAAQQVAAGQRKTLPMTRTDDAVRRFIALVDECYERRIPLYLEAAVPLEQLYPEGFLAFPFRRTLSRLQEMQRLHYGQLPY